MFRALLNGADGSRADFSFVVYDCREGEGPRDPGECDGYVITGSRHGVNDDLPWLEPLFGRLRDLHAAGRPMAGFASDIRRWPARWRGSPQGPGRMAAGAAGMAGFEVRPVDASAAFQIAAFVQLSGPSDDSSAGGGRVGWRRILSGAAFAVGNSFAVQGHPEFPPAFSRALMEFRRDDVDAKILKERAESAGNENDSEICAQWMRELLRGGAGGRGD